MVGVILAHLAELIVYYWSQAVPCVLPRVAQMITDVHRDL